MERSILHLDLDTFFVSVERLLHPELAKKPALVGGTGTVGWSPHAVTRPGGLGCIRAYQ